MALIVNATLANIQLAATNIKNGELVAFPTETVYGLGANALDSIAVKKIFILKNRPIINPLIVHFSNLSEVLKYFKLNPTELKLAKTFWPGALTLILKNFTSQANQISTYCKGGVNSLAVRIPNNSIALKLIKMANCPIAAPSANISNKLSPTLAQHVYHFFNKEELLILEGGKSTLGLESTIIEVIDDQTISILRHGTITKDMLNNNLPLKIINTNQANLKAPGMLKKHYSPTTPLRLNVTSALKDEALLAFGNINNEIKNNFKEVKKILNLSKNANLKEAASNLFTMLWELDLEKYKCIAVMPIPNTGVGIAINERLRKAAAKKL